MARTRLSRCFRVPSQYARTYSSNANQPLLVAQLLQTPQDENSEARSAKALDHVVVNGFIRSIRNQKLRSFASLGDGSSLEPLQALLTPEQAQGLFTGTAVQLVGSWQMSPNPRLQSHELHVKEVKIIGTANPATFPLQKKYHTPEFLRSVPHLRTRTPFNSTLLRFRSESIACLTKFFAERSFIQAQPPIITSSDCEGAGEVFRVESARKASSGTSEDTFFKSPKYLTVSSQLHLEALAQSVGKVWALSPTFRAEKSDTARHLSEFYMLEAEISFTESLEDVMTLTEDMIRSLVYGFDGSRVSEEIVHGKRSGDEKGETLIRRGMLIRRWDGILQPFGKITYTDAIKLLHSSSEHFEHTPQWGFGLQAEHERYLAKVVGTKGEPVFVTHYPKSTKPFYMLNSTTTNKEQETVECFDLIVPEICEIVGGSMREHRLDQLINAMRAHGLLSPGAAHLSDEELDHSGMKWYIDLRRWGSVPHGGFGLGFDRLLAYLAGVPNIREMVTFPRWAGRCDC